MSCQKISLKHPKIHFLTVQGEPGSAQGRDCDWSHKLCCPWAPLCRANTQPRAGTVQGHPAMGIPTLAGLQIVLLDGHHWLLNEGRNAHQLREFGRDPSLTSPVLCGGAGLTLVSPGLGGKGRAAVQHKDFRRREKCPLNTTTDISFEPRLLRLSWSRADRLPPATALINFQQIYSLSNGATWTQPLPRAKTLQEIQLQATAWIPPQMMKIH